MITQRPMCDVAVIGAGPAGLTVASELAESGRDVVVLDEQAHPVDKFIKESKK